MSILVSAFILILTPIIFSTANLDQAASATPLEMFVSFIGIVLLTPVFLPEQNAEIHDLVASKYISTNIIYLIRTAYAIALLLAFIGLFGIYMRLQNCDVPVLLLIGTAANAVFLGSLGMLTAAFAGNTVIAYMMPLLYYALNYGTGSKLGNYYLFSMSHLDFRPKIWLLLTGLLLIAASLIINGIKKKLQ